MKAATKPRRRALGSLPPVQAQGQLLPTGELCTDCRMVLDPGINRPVLTPCPKHRALVHSPLFQPLP